MTYRTLFTPDNEFLKTRTSKTLLIVNSVLALAYFIILTFLLPKGNTVLFSLLILGEVFHVWQILTYLYTVWDMKDTPYKQTQDFTPDVDVFITVAGEPVDIVGQTVRAALEMDYPNHHVYILNDGYVAKKDNWRDMEALAKRTGASCITRTLPGGAKAGNINHGLLKTTSPFVVVFDADQVPHKDFLIKSMSYFIDTSVGFVQSPQYYKNYELNEVTKGAWEQQELFFGPICRGKNRLNSTFLCGTNMVMRRSAILSAGGMCETNIAEDFLTSLFIHEQGWKSVYVPEVLAEGLAPEDFKSYYKQQHRWARGSLEVLFKYNPLFRKGLSFAQKIQYMASASYYLSGVIVLMNALLPIIFFFTGLVPIAVSTMTLAAVFLPYIVVSIWVLRLSSNYSYTFRALGFSMSSFTIHLQALWAVLTNHKTGFSVTAKKAESGSFIRYAVPHIAYYVLVAVGLGVAVIREGFSAAVVTNLSWALFNTSVFLPFIVAAGSPDRSTGDEEVQITYQPSLGRAFAEETNPARDAYPVMYSVTDINYSNGNPMKQSKSEIYNRSSN